MFNRSSTVALAGNMSVAAMIYLQEKQSILEATEVRMLLRNNLKNPKVVHVKDAPQSSMCFISGNGITYLLKRDQLPRYGFKVKAKNTEYDQLFKSESNREGAKSNGYSFDKTQNDYHGNYE